MTYKITKIKIKQKYNLQHYNIKQEIRDFTELQKISF